LYDNFPIQNGLKQGDVLLPMLCIFALEYAISKIQQNQVGSKLNETHQLLSYAVDVNLLENMIDTITLIDTSEKVGLEINVERKVSLCCCAIRIRVQIMT
jgi:hypothetical protein